MFCDISNACKSDTFQKRVPTLNWTVLEDYWELGAPIETTSPEGTRPEHLRIVFESVTSRKSYQHRSL